jgi:hypothetical protein
MSAQIFKNMIPSEKIFNLLDSLCIKNNKYYLFDFISFKKGVFTNEINNFLEYCKPYYHISKRKYLEKELTYNSFTTVLRQICNFNKINFTSQIKYDKSNYEIVYFIYFL